MKYDFQSNEIEDGENVNNEKFHSLNTEMMQMSPKMQEIQKGEYKKKTHLRPKERVGEYQHDQNEQPKQNYQNHQNHQNILDTLSFHESREMESDENASTSWKMRLRSRGKSNFRSEDLRYSSDDTEISANVNTQKRNILNSTSKLSNSVSSMREMEETQSKFDKRWKYRNPYNEKIVSKDYSYQGKELQLEDHLKNISPKSISNSPLFVDISSTSPSDNDDKWISQNNPEELTNVKFKFQRISSLPRIITSPSPPQTSSLERTGSSTQTSPSYASSISPLTSNSPSLASSPPSPPSPQSSDTTHTLQFIAPRTSIREKIRNYFLSLVSMQLHITIRFFIIMIIIPILYMTYIHIPSQKSQIKAYQISKHQEYHTTPNIVSAPEEPISEKQLEFMKIGNNYIYRSMQPLWGESKRSRSDAFRSKLSLRQFQHHKHPYYYSTSEETFNQEMRRKDTGIFKKLFFLPCNIFHRLRFLLSPRFYFRLIIKAIASIILTLASIVYTSGVVVKNITLEFIGIFVASIVILWPIFVNSNDKPINNIRRSSNNIIIRIIRAGCICCCLPCQCVIFALRFVFTTCFIVVGLIVTLGCIISITVGFSSDIIWIPVISSSAKAAFNDFSTKTQSMEMPLSIHHIHTFDTKDSYFLKLIAFPRLFFSNDLFSLTWFFQYSISLAHVLRFYAYCGITASVIMLVIVCCERSTQCWRWTRKTKRRVTHFMFDD